MVEKDQMPKSFPLKRFLSSDLTRKFEKNKKFLLNLKIRISIKLFDKIFYRNLISKKKNFSINSCFNYIKKLKLQTASI